MQAPSWRRRRGGIAVLVAAVAATLVTTGGGGLARQSSAAAAVHVDVGPCDPRAVLQGWSTAELAAQTFVFPVYETDALAGLPAVEGGAGGVILFSNTPPPGLTDQLAELSAAAPPGRPLLVMSDEEGGLVQRLAPVTGGLPAARDMAATMTPAQITALAARAGARLRSAGVNMDLAPVLDLDAGLGPSNADADGTRSFSADPTLATTDGLAFANGLEQGGVIPVVKHFPGLGGASPNTDVAPAQTQPWAQLQTSGLLPFAAAAQGGVPAVMVANASVPGLSSGPASMSSAVMTDELRGKLHFGGLVMTDSLSAGAVVDAGYSAPEAAVVAVRSGADMILFTDASGPPTVTFTSAESAIEKAVANGSLPRARLIDAAEHVLEIKGAGVCQVARCTPGLATAVRVPLAPEPLCGARLRSA